METAIASPSGRTKLDDGSKMESCVVDDEPGMALIEAARSLSLHGEHKFGDELIISLYPRRLEAEKPVIYVLMGNVFLTRPHEACYMLQANNGTLTFQFKDNDRLCALGRFMNPTRVTDN